MMLAWLSKRLSDGRAEAVISGRGLVPFPAAEVDRLLRRRVLVERRKADTWPACAHCDCGLGGRPIREIDGRQLACCPDDPAEDEELTEADLRRFAIDPRGLAGAIAAAGGLGDPEPITDDLWLLGRLASGRSVVLAFRTATLAFPGVPDAIRAAAGGPTTILAPELPAAERVRLKEAGFAPVPLAEALIADATGAIRLDWLDGAPAEAEVLVRKGSGTIVWRGTTIGFTHQQFPVLLRLLEGTRSRSRVASGPVIEDTTGREAKDLIRELRQRVEAAGFSTADAKQLFKAVRGRGYALGISPESIAVLD